MTFTDMHDGRVFVHAEQPQAVVSVTSPGTVGVFLDESDLIELLATVQERPVQLGATSSGEL